MQYESIWARIKEELFYNRGSCLTSKPLRLMCQVLLTISFFDFQINLLLSEQPYLSRCKWINTAVIFVLSIGCLKNGSYKIIHMCTDTIASMITAFHIMPDVRYAVVVKDIIISGRCRIDHCIVWTRLSGAANMVIHRYIESLILQSVPEKPLVQDKLHPHNRTGRDASLRYKVILFLP